MAEIREITAMCKTGNVDEAYQLAKAEFASMPSDVWVQRMVGWALYYMIKRDVEEGNYEKLLVHIDELKTLDNLSIDRDNMIFDNVQFKIAEFVKNCLSPQEMNSSTKLSTLFSKLRDYHFMASKGHSFLLQSFIKYETWSEMADFIDWWNLDNLTEEDYIPYVNSKGQKMITLAERAFIAHSKALLKLNDVVRIEEFLPKLDTLMTQHEEMMYPGYFYGKLLLVLGSDKNETLRVLIPFARKKVSEFWVWQLLGEVFAGDEEIHLACLLRAVHCRTQESYLGKLRVKLAALYIQRGLLNHARHHIDAVVRCYVAQGWRLPPEIDVWIHYEWFKTTTPDAHNIIDYKSITDEILCDGAEESIALVTYVDAKSHKCSMVYGYEQTMSQKLRCKVGVGHVLKLHYIIDKEGHHKVISATKITLPDGLNYAKCVEGSIVKRDDKDFAFLKVGSIHSFVSPGIVNKHHLKHGDRVKSLIVYDYHKKKESWNWVCVNMMK